jgi:hypothetical protein
MKIEDDAANKAETKPAEGENTSQHKTICNAPIFSTKTPF